VKLIEVSDASARKKFLEVPLSIYKNDPNWVRPLDNDINAVFDPEKNNLFNSGEAIRWILRDEKNQLIGRVAAFVNEKTAHTSEYVTGGLGFFECINNQEAANLLFDACKQWLSSKGMEAMDGPINFGDRSAWWGLLVEGFSPPTYQMNYNPPYYEELFEAYGFQTYFNQLVFNYRVDKEVPGIFREKAERIFRSTAFRFEHINKKQLEKYGTDLTDIYNAAWSKMGHFKPVTKEQTMATMKKMLPIMDEKIVWFGYFKDRPIAFFIMLPEINQVIRYLNGRMDWFGKLKFAYYRWRGVIDKMFGVLFGVVPEFQGKGIDGAVIIAAAKTVQPMKKYRDLEMNWIGDFNPKMIKMVENLGTTVSKRYRTYRKLFDPSKPFYRAEIVE
jgi:GNAT superfamily N-acetyltransferase